LVKQVTWLTEFRGREWGMGRHCKLHRQRYG
jgi:hypothetical protein